MFFKWSYGVGDRSPPWRQPEAFLGDIFPSKEESFDVFLRICPEKFSYVLLILLLMMLLLVYDFHLFK